MSLEKQNVKYSEPQLNHHGDFGGSGLTQPSNTPHERLGDAIQDLGMVSLQAQNLLDRITGNGTVEKMATTAQDMSLSGYPLSGFLHAGRDSVSNFEDTMRGILSEIEANLFD
jgi:hypothetical protein